MASVQYPYHHRVVAAQALGRPLPAGSVVYLHTPTQFVICQDVAYHVNLQSRKRVLQAGGDPDLERICPRCERLRRLTQFYWSKGRRGPWCKSCVSAANKEKRK